MWDSMFINISRSVSDSDSDGGVHPLGGFSFDVYEVNHDPAAIRLHHELEKQHNQRKLPLRPNPFQS